ncbi:uncharacterized protein [Triticum aestivum]|nr:uncharacterized protein LOC123050759 [Triticum aestivum]
MARRMIPRVLPPFDLPPLDARHPCTPEEFDNFHTCRLGLALHALKHYNSKHPDAEFWSPDQPKVASTGFRDDIWYHLNFFARRKEDDDDEERFFAELRFIQCPRRLIIKSCTILSRFYYRSRSHATQLGPFLAYSLPLVSLTTEEPLCRFKSSCALCPDESKILHPNHVQLGCGKKEHEEELYHEKHRWDWDPRRKDYFRREMLEEPFQLDRCPNFGREKRGPRRGTLT